MSNNAIAIAVVIPYYNGSRFIERALASVAAQSLPAAEVVVVNDGSTDAERAALDELQARYTFRIVDRGNRGQGAARNTGVVNSTADYICFLDQDDFYLPDHNATLAAAVPRDDAQFGWVYADLNRADARGKIEQERFIRERATHPKRDLADMIARDMFVLPSAALISRKAFEAIGGFDGQFSGYEDDDLFLRLHLAGFTNYFIDQPVTVWCIHNESTTYSMRMVSSRYRYYRKLDKAQPQFSAALARRFGLLFAFDAILTSSSAHPLAAHRPEILAILDEFSKRARDDRNLPAWQRLSIRALSAYLNSLPVVSGRLAMKLASLTFPQDMQA
jgi:glycosyltransferase involved in cell wall biosynthesis